VVHAVLAAIFVAMQGDLWHSITVLIGAYCLMAVLGTVGTRVLRTGRRLYLASRKFGRRESAPKLRCASAQGDFKLKPEEQETETSVPDYHHRYTDEDNEIWCRERGKVYLGKRYKRPQPSTRN